MELPSGTEQEAAINLINIYQRKVINILEGKSSNERWDTESYYNELIGTISILIDSFSITRSDAFKKLIRLQRGFNKADTLALYGDILNLLNNLRNEVLNTNLFRPRNSDEIKTSSEYISAISKLIDENDKANKKLNDDNVKLNNKVINLQSQLTANVSDTNLRQTRIEAFELSERNHVENTERLNTELATTKAELDNLKNAKQKTEVARNSTNFQDQANKNKVIALLVMLGIFICLGCFIWFLFNAFANNEELYKVAENIFEKKKLIDKSLLNQIILFEIAKKVCTKLLIFSLIIYLISFLVKNYNAQMHNYIVNSHKANALQSTLSLIGTARQDEGNDKIVLQATQAIFTNQKSGYQGAENEPPSPNLITNVIDAVSGGKKN